MSLTASTTVSLLPISSQAGKFITSIGLRLLLLFPFSIFSTKCYFLAVCEFFSLEEYILCDSCYVANESPEITMRRLFNM